MAHFGDFGDASFPLIQIHKVFTNHPKMQQLQRRVFLPGQDMLAAADATPCRVLVLVLA